MSRKGSPTLLALIDRIRGIADDVYALAGDERDAKDEMGLARHVFFRAMSASLHLKAARFEEWVERGMGSGRHE